MAEIEPTQRSFVQHRQSAPHLLALLGAAASKQIKPKTQRRHRASVGLGGWLRRWLVRHDTQAIEEYISDKIDDKEFRHKYVDHDAYIAHSLRNLCDLIASEKHYEIYDLSKSVVHNALLIGYDYTENNKDFSEIIRKHMPLRDVLLSFAR